MVKKVNVVMMAIAFMVVANFGAWAQDARTQADESTLKLNQTTVELRVGERFELQVVSESPNVGNANANVREEKPDKVEWKSSNERVVTVDKDGVIVGVNEGRATVTASAGKKEGKCEVTVVLTREEKE